MTKDSSNHASLLCKTRFEFQNRRIVHEMCFKLEEHTAGSKLEIFVNSGPFEVKENDAGFPLSGLSSANPREQCETLMAFIDSSRFCTGFWSESEENTEFAVKGIFRDLGGSQSVKEEIAIFSSKCRIVSPSGGLCIDCNKLHRQCQHRARRRSFKKYQYTSEFWNNRWLSKEDVLNRYFGERRKRVNAEAREKTLIDNIRKCMIIMEEEDHQELSSIISHVDKTDVPPEMSLLWDEQLKIFHTKSSLGNRWHPKWVLIFHIRGSYGSNFKQYWL